MEIMAPLDSTELELQYDTKNYVDMELSYDHFSDADKSIIILKNENKENWF